MKLLKVDTLEEARKKLLQVYADIPVRTEKRGLLEALGYTLSEDIYACESVPGFRRSAVDGYALHFADTGGASEALPVLLRVVGEVYMGVETSFTLKRGECAYVPTGGMLPVGADACVMIEYCEELGNAQAAVSYAAFEGENVIHAGEDMCIGDLVLKRGEVLKPGSLGAASAIGVTQVPVFTPWRVAIISTGDELVWSHEQPLPGQVRDINTYGIQMLARQLKFEISSVCVVRDDREMLKKHIDKTMKDSDIVVISGGSSKGKKDVTKEVIEAAASEGVFTEGLALKPGKPTILGYDRPAETLLAGLPGHPVAAMLVFELIVKWLWREKTGGQPDRWIPARLTTNVPGAPGKCTCQLVRLISDDTKMEYQAEPVWGKSGLIHTLSEADGYIMIEEDVEGLRKGEPAAVFLL